MENILRILIILCFLILGLPMINNDLGYSLDYKILDILHKKDNLILEILSKVMSFLGSLYGVVVILILLYFYFRDKNKKYVKAIIYATLTSSGINFILKNIFRRIRPISYFRIDYLGYSFPSGHAMVNMTLWISIAYILENKYGKKKLNKFIYLFVLLMGLSRVYLGVHWPSDVFIGYLLGYLVFDIMIKNRI